MLVLLVVENYRKQRLEGLQIFQLIKPLVGRWWYHKSYFFLTGSICSSYASALTACCMGYCISLLAAVIVRLHQHHGVKVTGPLAVSALRISA